MGGAFIKGLHQSGGYSVTACDVDEAVLETISPYCDRTTTELSVAAESEVVVLALKPDLVGAILSDLELTADQTLLSIAAGVSTELLESKTEATVVRIMPNLAAEYGMMAAAVTESTVTDEIRAILDAVGEFVEVSESKMDIATAVNGSGPAFVFYLINAMAEAGVDGGLSPEDARTLAAQTFKGAAETVLQSDRSIEDLIDAVCSPKGTTIEGMDVLWDSDVEAEVGEAVAAAEERSKELAQDAADE
ncbi:pyrroline-5-carboxylate reductase [Halohasta litchfieldiae]|jgi:pyrroline-5-carboxylate reductase|uniref:Pyrroline-5-carboxylate reductase n=2 Tax=Halohasta litchfieldiae TaxID=1073996 RepID=A0A1H6UFY3_9EURY|nr:pyrroline-5-carboxylate reductase [Halohasta litchfieldiae]